MQKLIRTADLRKTLDKYNREEISYGKMVEMLNKAANEALSLGGVSQQRELLDWLSNEPDHNIRKSDIEEILQDFKYYQSNCG